MHALKNSFDYELYFVLLIKIKIIVSNLLVPKFLELFNSSTHNGSDQTISVMLYNCSIVVSVNKILIVTRFITKSSFINLLATT